MPHDKQGNQLAIGDAVVLRGTVIAVHEGETACNVTVEASERPSGEEYIPQIAGNSRFYEKASGPNTLPEDVPNLVARGKAIKAQQKSLAVELADINALLIKERPGDYHGARVVGEYLKLAPGAEEAEAVRDLLEDEDDGAATFKKLFDRTVVYSAVKSFREIAAALLTPAKARKVIALCEKPNAGFVIWPK